MLKTQSASHPPVKPSPNLRSRHTQRVPTASCHVLTDKGRTHLGYNGKKIKRTELCSDNLPVVQLVKSQGHHEGTKQIDVIRRYVLNKHFISNVSVEHLTGGDVDRRLHQAT